MSHLPELLTTAEVMATLRVSKATVSRWAKNGKLDVVRLGPRSNRYRRTDIEALLANEDEPGELAS